MNDEVSIDGLISRFDDCQAFLSMAREVYNISPEWAFMLNPRRTLDLGQVEKYSFLVKTCQQLKQLCDDGTLKDRIKQIPLLEIDEDEYEILIELHLMYAVLLHCYVWCEGEDNSPDVIPENIAVPIMYLSNKLGILPAVCHANMMLCNTVLIDPNGPLDISNLRLKYSLSNYDFTMDWFFCVTAQVEFDCAPVMTTIFECCYFMLKDDSESLISSFSKLPALIQKIESSFRLMHKHLNASRFYNELRPYLNGWKTKGKIFEGVSTEPIKVYGGSAAQASGIQCIDSFLGVQHSADKKKFLCEMTRYMPPAHRKLINDIRSMKINMQIYAERSQNEELIRIHAESLQAMVSLRSTHIQICAKYIVIQARKIENQYSELKKLGTAGQNILPFLRDIRKTTGEAQIQSESPKE